MDRLVSTSDSLPIAIALSLRTGIPVVYSWGDNQAPTHDLIGAYDIGHPALLVVNTLGDIDRIESLVSRAQRVGLEINHILSVIDFEQIEFILGLQVQSLINMTQAVDYLAGSKQLPDGHVQWVLSWLNRRQD
jgi:hypothetical protein